MRRISGKSRKHAHRRIEARQRCVPRFCQAVQLIAGPRCRKAIRQILNSNLPRSAVISSTGPRNACDG